MVDKIFKRILHQLTIWTMLAWSMTIKTSSVNKQWLSGRVFEFVCCGKTRKLFGWQLFLMYNLHKEDTKC